MAGRGQLSSLDLLPEDAADDVAWAVQQLAGRNRTQEDIRFELNDRLEAKGIEGISRSAFNRKAVRLAAVQRRLSESRALFEGLAPQFTADRVDDSNVILGELIKTLIQELLVDDSARDPKGAMELASAYQKTVSAMKISSDRRAKLEAAMAEKVDQTITKVAAVTGLSAERTAQVRRDFLGVRVP